MSKQQQGKRGGGGAGSSGAGGGVVAEERLQAVVLADTFHRPMFRPFTAEQPKMLLPLVNAPMLEYTLEFLSVNGVQDIFILASAHAEQINEYMKTTRWFHKGRQLRVRVEVLHRCHSVGDALRAVLTQRLIDSSHFVLVSGDVIANIDLAGIVAGHRARSKARDSLLMTMVFAPAPPAHASRALDEDLVVGYDAHSGELLLYDDSLNESTVFLMQKATETHPAIRVRYDLRDAHIAVCSRRVLDTFQGDFDFEDLRTNLVKSVVEKENDIQDDKIHAVRSTRPLPPLHYSRFPSWQTRGNDSVHHWVSWWLVWYFLFLRLFLPSPSAPPSRPPTFLPRDSTC